VKSYKASHTGQDRGLVYDDRYSRGYTAAMWQNVEHPLLKEIFSKFGKPSLSCLDFACGTGRITQLLPNYFGEVTGIDISADMLDQARTKCQDAKFVCGDLLENPSMVGEFDVITSFRFFPNAEHRLREKAMQTLVSHLKPNGVLILNNHQNSKSLLGLLRKIRGSTRDFMAPEVIPELLAANGMVVREKYGFGKLPIWRDWSIVPAGLISRYEAKRVSSGSDSDGKLNIVYIAERK